VKQSLGKVDHDADGIKHDMARATVRNDEPATHVAVYVAAVLGGVVGFAVLLACSCGLRWGVKRHRELVAIEKKRKVEQKERVARALRQTELLAYPMCLIAYSHFKTLGKLITHEEARAQGILRILDTVDDVREAVKSGYIIFISHQWIGQGEPDFSSLHFRSVCSSVEALQEQFCQGDQDRRSVADQQQQQQLQGKSQAQVSSDAEVWLWIDYTSIPQRVASLQLLSIHSLFIYAGLSTHFLIVTPSVKNGLTGRIFDLSTYLQRGWCRLECWARFSQSEENVFVVFGNEDGFHIKPGHQEPSVFQNCMEIFNATFTEEQDKKKLVDTAVALYWQMLRRQDSLESHLKMAFGRMRAAKDEYFPPSFCGNLIELTEELSKETNDKTSFCKQLTYQGTLPGTSTCMMCNGTGVV